jgi:hypothetical protein
VTNHSGPDRYRCNPSGMALCELLQLLLVHITNMGDHDVRVAFPHSNPMEDRRDVLALGDDWKASPEHANALDQPECRGVGSYLWSVPRVAQGLLLALGRAAGANRQGPRRYPSRPRFGWCPPPRHPNRRRQPPNPSTPSPTQPHESSTVESTRQGTCGARRHGRSSSRHPGLGPHVPAPAPPWVPIEATIARRWPTILIYNPLPDREIRRQRGGSKGMFRLERAAVSGARSARNFT